MCRRSPYRADEDVAGAVLDAHQRSLANRARLVPGVRHDDDRQPRLAEGGAFGPTTPLVELHLITHPLPGAGDVLRHSSDLLAFLALRAIVAKPSSLLVSRPAVVPRQLRLRSALVVLVVAAPPEALLVPPLGCAVEPLVHAPEAVQSARIGGIGLVDDTVLEGE